MNLPYNLIIQLVAGKNGNHYFGRVLELDGCHSHGATQAEALENLRDAMEGWISVGLEYGDIIPEPLQDGGFSGKFLLRLPKSLHHRLVLEAEKEGVSLNQYALYKLSR